MQPAEAAQGVAPSSIFILARSIGCDSYWVDAAVADVFIISDAMSSTCECIWSWRSAGICGVLYSRLYVVSFPIVMHFKKPVVAHSWYPATGAGSVVAGGLREDRGVWWYTLSVRSDERPCSAWESPIIACL
jgi:hypothetical protein